MKKSVIKYDDQDVGVVGFVTSHSHQCTGTIALTPFGETFRPLWHFIENHGIDEIPFDESMMDDSRWTFVIEGMRHDIYFPMVLENGLVIWQWR